MELAIAPEHEDKYSFVPPSSAPADLMDRLGRAIRLTARYAIAQWENMNFDEKIQADPTLSIELRRKGRKAEGLGFWFDGAAVAAF